MQECLYRTESICNAATADNASWTIAILCDEAPAMQNPGISRKTWEIRTGALLAPLCDMRTLIRNNLPGVRTRGK